MGVINRVRRVGYGLFGGWVLVVIGLLLRYQVHQPGEWVGE